MSFRKEGRKNEQNEDRGKAKEAEEETREKKDE